MANYVTCKHCGANVDVDIALADNTGTQLHPIWQFFCDMACMKLHYRKTYGTLTVEND